jgi:peptidoglycan/xylan/chitin deacetylase (PgdA/CDA1 family)
VAFAPRTLRAKGWSWRLSPTGDVQIQQAIKQILRASIPAPVRRAVRRSLPRREQLAEARLFCERQSLAVVGSHRPRARGRILCYHSVGQPEFGVNDVHPARFRRHIELSLKAGYRFVHASEIAQTGGGPKDLAISFDDGLKSVSTAAAPILQEYAIPYVVFAVSDWSDMKDPRWIDRALDWRDLELLLKDGAEVGSHSVSHPDFGKIGHQRAVDELCISREVIRQRLGFAPDTFAIPFGQSMNWPAACALSAREAGYRIVYAQAEETRPEGTVARTFVTKHDNDRIFKALLSGHYDRWEEWF